MRLALVFFSAVIFASAARSASAADAKDTAGQLIEEGNRLFKKKQYEPALARYEAAYQVYPSPKILFNVASVHETLGHRVKAIELFEQFLRVSGVESGSKLQITATQKIASLRREVGKLEITADSIGTEAYLDTRPLGVAPIAPFWVAPGEHQIAGRLAGVPPFNVRITVAAGEAKSVELKMVQAVPPIERELDVPPVVENPPAHEDKPLPPQMLAHNEPQPKVVIEQTAPPSEGASAVPWIVAGAGVAVVGAGAVFGVLAKSRDQAAHDDSNGARALDLESDRDRFARFANIGFISGGAVCVIGLVWGIIDAASSSPAPAASPVLGPRSVTLVGRF